MTLLVVVRQGSESFGGESPDQPRGTLGGAPARQAPPQLRRRPSRRPAGGHAGGHTGGHAVIQALGMSGPRVGQLKFMADAKVESGAD